jgi:hypothetical protein
MPFQENSLHQLDESGAVALDSVKKPGPPAILSVAHQTVRGGWETMAGGGEYHGLTATADGRFQVLWADR